MIVTFILNELWTCSLLQMFGELLVPFPVEWVSGVRAGAGCSEDRERSLSFLYRSSCSSDFVFVFVLNTIVFFISFFVVFLYRSEWTCGVCSAQ